MKRIVIKIGTAVLTKHNGMLDEAVVESLAVQISTLISGGKEILIVSSGAIGAGMYLCDIKKKPANLSELQALAAIGQTKLMDTYNKYFNKSGYLAGQILLTQDDFDDRKRFVNIKYTINALVRNKAIPIINENDTISTEEIKCGDNDRISSLVADLSDSDCLVILSNVDGLLDNDGKVIREVKRLDHNVKSFALKERSELGSGGMCSKLSAVEFAVKSGVECYIANGKKENILIDIFDKSGDFTRFHADKSKHSARKRWIGFGSKPKGALAIDDGAKEAIMEKNKSLLPAGITGITGDFQDGDIISILDRKGIEIARGITNYASGEVDKIKGRKTGEIDGILGYESRDEVINRDNLIIL